MIIRAGSIQRFTSVLQEPFGAEIGRLEGVRDVVPTLVDVVSFEGDDVFGVVIQGLPRDRGPLREFRIDSGRAIGIEDRRAILLGRVLARNLDKRVGDKLEVVPGEPYDIVGIYDSYNVFENGSIAMALDELQALMGRTGEVTYFTVTSADKDRSALEQLRSRIEGLTAGIAALPTREYIDTSVEIRMARASAWLTSTIALIVGAVGMINTMLTTVFERTREIALLRTVGCAQGAGPAHGSARIHGPLPGRIRSRNLALATAPAVTGPFAGGRASGVGPYRTGSRAAGRCDCAPGRLLGRPLPGLARRVAGSDQRIAEGIEHLTFG